MKRSSNAKKNQGDFKRLKAKVGKRAPKKLNETETKFKTATVQVQTQSISNEDIAKEAQNGSLISSRGKHITQLISQMNHHAAKARASAVQGLKDVIISSPAAAIPFHLSLLVPSLAKGIVDEDFSVRKLAISTFFEHMAPKLELCNMSVSMKPFLQLVLAYIGSALHSLDQDIRYSGCKALEMLCQSYEAIFLQKGSEEEIAKLRTTILAFVNLFDDVSGGLASMSRRGVGTLEAAKESTDSAKNKQKQKKSARAITVLKSFLVVTKITITFEGGDNLLDDNIQSTSNFQSSLSKEDLNYISKGISNSLVWKKSLARHVPKASTLHGLSIRQSISSSNESTRSTKLSVDSILHLFTKLRDRLVEVSQRSQSRYFSPSDASECHLIVTCIRYLWKGFSLVDVSPEIPKKSSNHKKLQILAANTLSLLMEIFPVSDVSGNAENVQIYDSLNASLCMVFSELGCCLDNYGEDLDDERKWVQTIFSYVVPHMDIDLGENSKSFSLTASNTRNTLLSVIGKLLLGSGSLVSKSNLDETKKIELVTTVGEIYFSPKNFHRNICKSDEGRKAVGLLVSLINCTDDNDDSELKMKLLDMLSFLPRYLLAWRGKFPKDTAVSLASLLSICRKCGDNPCSEKSDSSLFKFCDNLRSSLEPLFESSKTNKVMKVKLSVFEEVSYVSQKLLLSLIGLLKNPSEDLLDSLAHICSRKATPTTEIAGIEDIPVISEDMIDTIIGTIHSINRTIPLHQYLTFLIESSGINDATFQNKLEMNAEDSNQSSYESLFIHDKSIARLCRYLVLTGSKKALTMITPILSMWITPQKEDNLSFRLLKTRAALAIISCFSIQFKVKHLQDLLPNQDFVVDIIEALYLTMFYSPRGVVDDRNSREIQTRMMSTSLVRSFLSNPLMFYVLFTKHFRCTALGFTSSSS